MVETPEVLILLSFPRFGINGFSVCVVAGRSVLYSSGSQARKMVMTRAMTMKMMYDLSFILPDVFKFGSVDEPGEAQANLSCKPWELVVETLPRLVGALHGRDTDSGVCTTLVVPIRLHSNEVAVWKGQALLDAHTSEVVWVLGRVVFLTSFLVDVRLLAFEVLLELTLICGLYVLFRVVVGSTVVPLVRVGCPLDAFTGHEAVMPPGR